jgi:alkylated DNA repair dioxygenase AlkB
MYIQNNSTTDISRHSHCDSIMWREEIAATPCGFPVHEILKGTSQMKRNAEYEKWDSGKRQDINKEDCKYVVPIVVLKDGDEGAFAYVIPNGLGTPLADELFDFMEALPVDNRPHDILKEELLDMDNDGYAAYQKRIGGFTNDRYKFFNALSGRRVCAHYAPNTTGKKSYTYSGQTREALPMVEGDALHRTCLKVSNLTATEFDLSLNNQYLDINHYLSHHRDDEKDLAPGPITSCVVGASRTFEFKYIKTKGQKDDKPNVSCGADKWGRVRIMLRHGDVLVMVRQGRWSHSVPKSAAGIHLVSHMLKDRSLTDMRYSITLRKMKMIQ